MERLDKTILAWTMRVEKRWQVKQAELLLGDAICGKLKDGLTRTDVSGIQVLGYASSCHKTNRAYLFLSVMRLKGLSYGRGKSVNK